MRMNDIEISDVRLGKNWRLIAPMKNWSVNSIEVASLAEEKDGTTFRVADQVIYSALIAFPSGRVVPLLLFKRVGDVEYGGVYWEFVDGRWRLVGVEPYPDYEIGGQEFIANPLVNDPSFNASDHDYRAAHRSGFLKHAHAL